MRVWARQSEAKGLGESPSKWPVRVKCWLIRTRGWLEVGRESLLLRWGAGSLTRDFPCNVHSHGDSEAKTQVDTKEAAEFIS